MLKLLTSEQFVLLNLLTSERFILLKLLNSEKSGIKRYILDFSEKWRKLITKKFLKVLILLTSEWLFLKSVILD